MDLHRFPAHRSSQGIKASKIGLGRKKRINTHVRIRRKQRKKE